MSFTPTLTVLNALKTAITAIEWTPEGGEAEPAFQKVELFDVDDLKTALKELLVFKDRACFIIIDEERCTSEVIGMKMQSRQSRTIALIITDRDYGKRAEALTGDATRPGVLALKDLILDPENEVIGGLLDGMVVMPGFGAPIRIMDEERDNMTGRLAYELDLEIRGGFLEVRLGPGPIL
jgi:hypothetical protein